MYTVLSVSRNIRLLLSRNDTLAMAGFRVVSPRTPEEAPSLAQQKKVDALIVGHSVEPELRTVLMESVRSICPGCLIAFVFTHPETHGDPHADISVDVTDGNQPLIGILKQRLPKPIPAD